MDIKKFKEHVHVLPPNNVRNQPAFRIRGYNNLFPREAGVSGYWHNLKCEGNLSDLVAYLNSLQNIKRAKKQIVRRQWLFNFVNNYLPSFLNPNNFDILKFENGEQIFDLESGICHNAKINHFWADRSEYRQFLFGLFHQDHKMTEHPNSAYPVGGVVEYDANIHYGMWTNPKRWILLDYMIEQTQFMIDQLKTVE